MEDIFGISIGAAGVLALVVMMIVNAIKSDGGPKLKPWMIRLISVGVSFIIVLLTMLGKETFDWLVYIKVSLAVGMLASGIWDTSVQVGKAFRKDI